MIFLDIDVPRYITSDIQENKIPELQKTIRGKGVLEKSNDYGFENDIILKFEVNENTLKKMIKIYARFKTMTMIPVFDKNLKNKIFDIYSEYIKNTMENFTKNMNNKDLTDIIIEKSKIQSEILDETVFYNEEIQKKYSVNPKVKDCIMCFLKSFSYKSLEETSNGFEVEIVLYPCEDLSFYIGNEGTFLKSYYKKFADTKLSLFNEIDKKIDSIFEDKINNNDIYFKMDNIYNSQTTYAKNKVVENQNMPDDFKIENKYISGVEIRSINNLKRIPIVGKAKGFIQNLGQGEIGITLRLVYNQKNIEDKKTIIKLRNLAHFVQENIVTSSNNFYLTDCIGIKEVSISNIIVSEPTPEVDVTIINIFMIGSLTNKLEDESNYYMEVHRGNSNICSKIFSEFLDVGLQLDSKQQLIDFSKIIIFKSDIKDTEKYQNEDINKLNFTLKNLFESYYFEDYAISQQRYEEYKNNDYETTLKGSYKELTYGYSNLGNGFLNFGYRLFFDEKAIRDTVAYEQIANRLYKYAFLFLNNYNNGDNELFIQNLINAEKKTEVDFFEKIYSYYLAESFSLDMFKGSVGINNIVISNMFKIEIMNNFILIFKNLIDSNKEITKYLKGIKDYDEIMNNGILASPNKMKFIINGKFNNVIKEVIKQGIISVYSTAESFVNTSTFVEKSLDFYKLNYAKDITGINFSKIRESLEEERDILLSKIKDIKSNITNNDDVYFNNVLIIYKSIILNNRINLSKYDNYKMTLFDESSLLVAIVLSLYLPNFNYEKNLIGKISYSSAKNLIAPLSIATSAIELSKQFIITENKDLEINFEFINKLENIIELYFGKGSILELNKLSTTYITPNYSDKDYQKFLDINIFSNFDSPLEFFQDILNDSGLLIDAENHITKTEEIMNKVFSTYDITKIYKDLNNENSNNISQEIKDFNELFHRTNYIFDETINKQHIGTTIPVTIATTELISQYKTFRTMRDIFNLIIAQYKNMLPDYEVFIIDEQLISDAYEMGYDIDNKMYSIRNIKSINITKNDKTNIKTAIVKIANTRPQFIDMEYSFQERNLFESINNKEISVYDTKFKTDKLIFRSGLIINISLDSKNDFFDFTGKIDSVEINSSEIILTCSNFASELMSQKFNIDNIIRTGVKSILGSFSSIKEFFTGYKNPIEGTGTSKSYYINQHIIPKDFINGKLDDENLKYNLSAFMPCFAVGYYKSGDTIRHLSKSYNDLLQGMNLSKSIQESRSFFSRKWGTIFKKDNEDFVSSRILENVNAVEYDVSFYGFKDNGMNYSTTASTVIIPGMNILSHIDLALQYINKKENPIIMSSSSFIDRKNMFKDNNYKSFLGNKFSYERDNISLYDLLNDMTLRNPATFWDVIESGNFATLFFGRNNYIFTRKNKNSSISKTELLNSLFVIQKLLYPILTRININDKDLTFNKNNNIRYNDFEYIFLILRNIAIISDNNLGNHNESENKIRNTINLSKDFSNMLIRNINKVSKYYNGEYPIQNKIIAISGYNLISCNIKTMENFNNTISLNYSGDFEDKIDKWLRFEKSDIFTLKLFDGIPEFREIVKTIDPSLTLDINTREQASEYAQSVMFNDLKEYYSGKIVTLYQPDIRKNSELVIIDSYNKIYGTVIVRDFQHILSTEAGMITIITPGMKVGTTSLLSDIYMTDILGWFKHEQRTLKGNYNFKPYEVKSKMDTILNDLFLVSTSVPVTFENVEYEIKYDKENSEIESKGEGITSKKITVDKYVTTDIEITSSIKANSKLPYKVYPLVKNNKMLIPESDIYGRTEDAYYSIRKLFASLVSSLKNIIYGNSISNNFSYMLYILNSSLFPGRNGYLDDIIKSYFPAMKSADSKTKEEFIKRIFWDDYSNLLYSNNNYGIKIVKEFLERDNIVFFNTKQLSADDESTYNEEGNIISIGKIEKIAKIIFHFRIVNLIEINRYFDGKLNNKVLELLLEELNKLSSTVKGVKYKSWKLVTYNSIQNYDIYDDTVAVFVNLDKNPINNIEYFNISAKFTDMTGKTLEKVLTVLKYTININISYNLISGIDFYIFHNYYGGDFEDKALNVKIRSLLLVDLLKKVKKKSPHSRCIILGDFNLNLYDIIRNTEIIETTNNEIFIINNDFDIMLSNNITTQGGENYDNILIGNYYSKSTDNYNNSIIQNDINNSIKKYIKNNFIYNVFKYNTSPYYDEDVSDHFPIYLNSKDDKKIIY